MTLTADQYQQNQRLLGELRQNGLNSFMSNGHSMSDLNSAISFGNQLAQEQSAFAGENTLSNEMGGIYKALPQYLLSQAANQQKQTVSTPTRAVAYDPNYVPGIDPMRVVYNAKATYQPADLSDSSYADGGHVNGPGDGQSDSVPIMAADGEYVIPADVVSIIGNGSGRAGSRVLDKFCQMAREHARTNIVPDARGGLPSRFDAGSALSEILP